MSKIPTRWNLKLLYKSDNDPAIERDIKQLLALSKRFANKWEGRDDFLLKPKLLLDALNEYSEYIAKSTRLNAGIFYFYLRRDQDQRQGKVKARFAQLAEIESKVGNLTEFFDLKVARIEPKLQTRLLKDPKFKPYHYYLKRQFETAKYRLSLKEEQLMNLKSQPARNMWADMTAGLLAAEKRSIQISGGKKIEAGLEDILDLLDDKNKSVRDRAAAAFNSILSQYLEVGVNEINAILTDKKINDDLRGYKRPDLSRHLWDDIPTTAVDTLIDTVTKHNQVARDYYQLKAKLLGVKQLGYHERNLPYEEVKTKYSYSQAIQIVGGVFDRLDPALLKISERLISSGQVDVYPRLGKQSGAYCMPCGKGMPTYLLLNYTNKLRDVSTLAHEMGHAIHHELMNSAPPLYYNASTATSEVASNYFEGMVLNELAHGLEGEQKLSLLMTKLNDSISSTFRQAAFYKFETDLHDSFRTQGYVSAADIGKLFTRHTKDYMGPAVRQDPGSQNWWLYVSHFRNYFYVYSYVSGLLIANALIAYTREDPTFVSKVKEFLAAGGSASTRDLFRRVGVDINKPKLWATGVEQIKIDLDEAKKLAKSLGKV